ncbi:MAG TPA: 50S ribosomal protein L28 [Victivallales bacterium]|nr:50S ribosomal protein L28 [Victivallales bacterium]HPO90957.1 50S ribosomal protein L28 [Victivallales bacterium]HRR06184.1 50S ribosomal protein L28 [Victivallales bacterium]HRR28186.1 50S ribosomal protein L28 [Victivallales bacterium]HRU01152.1 50S ribosomal protein L28 [Victivallales bacterium]
MAKVCEICGKKKITGGTITRRGLAKKKGGIGTHVVKNNKRIFNANIQTIRVATESGTKTMKVCTACIRAGKIQKAPR